MSWFMLIIYLAPNGQPIMRSYHEYKTKEECISQSEQAKSFPHPFGLKVDITCKQLTITVKE
jgi:hypothetical protein